MQLEHAEHTLETIRTLMDRSQRYEHLSGYSGLLAGGTVLLGCTALGLNLLPFGPRLDFAAVWSAVFAIAFAGHMVVTFGRARQRGEPVWSRQARTVLLAVLPSFAVSLAITILMWRLDRLDLLPALWLLLYGCGALATSFFAPRSIAWLGATCLAMGIFSLAALPGHAILTMAAGFGATHIGFGVGVLVAERREARARVFWRQVERLAALSATE
ncbi:MAG TPA: hypothetical protein VNL17_11095 [Verrucomicrobiae bacterium]|nr:hypothetical protein [Verrucomicrobiae bacterium]